MIEQAIIDDLIVLGMAVPEEIKDGRRTVCLAGYSPTHGFIRVYPCRPDMGLKRWDIIRVEVERNLQDTRHESWKFVNSNPHWEQLNQYVSVVGHIKKREERYSLLASLIRPCVSEINEAKDSLGIIKPSNIAKYTFAFNDQYGKPRQLKLFERPGEWAKVKADFEFEPRVTYTCSECQTKSGRHDQKLLEWGFYEWMRKNPDNIWQVWKNMRIEDKEYDHFFFVGNQARYRTSFLVINIIPIKHVDLSDKDDSETFHQQNLF